MKKAKIRDIGVVAVASIIMISACPASSIADSHVIIKGCRDAHVGEVINPGVFIHNMIGWAVMYMVFQAPDGYFYSLIDFDFYCQDLGMQKFQLGLHYFSKYKYSIDDIWIICSPCILITDEMPKGQYTMYAALMRPSSRPESGKYLGFDKATFTIY